MVFLVTFLPSFLTSPTFAPHQRSLFQAKLQATHQRLTEIQGRLSAVSSGEPILQLAGASNA